MRVVAGSLRGRRLVAPPGRGVRPTSDRVREAVFAALGSLGAVEGAAVLDLFAGSGALGIEALSRGAERVVFVERDARALRALRQNLDAVGVGDRADVVRAEATSFLASTRDRWDLALLDPPYAFMGWEDLLAGLPADLAVIESDEPVAPPLDWAVVRERAYGGTVVTIARRAGPGRPVPTTPTT